MQNLAQCLNSHLETDRMNELILMIGLGVVAYLMIGYIISYFMMGERKNVNERTTITVFWLPGAILFVLAAALM